LPRPQDLDFDPSGTVRDRFPKGLARPLESAARQPPQPQRVERAPVDRRGNRRAYPHRSLGCVPRIHMAAPEGETPAAHRQERHVDTPGQVPHTRKEARVAGEIDARRPGDEDAQWAHRRREGRTAAAMFCVDGLERQIADLQAVAGSNLVDDSAHRFCHDAPEADRDDEHRRARKRPQGFDIQMVEVAVTDEDRRNINERIRGDGRHLTPDGHCQVAE